MRRIVSVFVPSVRPWPFDSRVIAAGLIATVALAANFVPWLLVAALGAALFYYFWLNQQRFVLFLIIYTPFEELVLKFLPDALYAPARYMWEAMLFALRKETTALRDRAALFRSDWYRKLPSLGMAVKKRRPIRKRTMVSSMSVKP